MGVLRVLALLSVGTVCVLHDEAAGASPPHDGEPAGNPKEENNSPSEYEGELEESRGDGLFMNALAAAMAGIKAMKAREAADDHHNDRRPQQSNEEIGEPIPAFVQGPLGAPEEDSRTPKEDREEQHQQFESVDAFSLKGAPLASEGIIEESSVSLFPAEAHQSEAYETKEDIFGEASEDEAELAESFGDGESKADEEEEMVASRTDSPALPSEPSPTLLGDLLTSSRLTGFLGSLRHAVEKIQDPKGTEKRDNGIEGKTDALSVPLSLPNNHSGPIESDKEITSFQETATTVPAETAATTEAAPAATEAAAAGESGEAAGEGGEIGALEAKEADEMETLMSLSKDINEDEILSDSNKKRGTILTSLHAPMVYETIPPAASKNSSNAEPFPTPLEKYEEPQQQQAPSSLEVMLPSPEETIASTRVAPAADEVYDQQLSNHQPANGRAAMRGAAPEEGEGEEGPNAKGAPLPDGAHDDGLGGPSKGEEDLGPVKQHSGAPSNSFLCVSGLAALLISASVGLSVF
ncbi:hypothetical protein Emag_006137 [Eimeria magna]